MADPRALSETGIGRYLVLRRATSLGGTDRLPPEPRRRQSIRGNRGRGQPLADRPCRTAHLDTVPVPGCLETPRRPLLGGGEGEPGRPGCVDGVLQRLGLRSGDRDRDPRSLGQRSRRRRAGHRCAGYRLRRRGQPARREHFRDRARGRRLVADPRDRGGRGPAQGRRREGRRRGNMPLGCRSCALCPGRDWICRALPRRSPP